MFVTNWISTTKIQKISEITNFFRHYFLSRTEVFRYKDNGKVGKYVAQDRFFHADFNYFIVLRKKNEPVQPIFIFYL